MPDRGKTAAVGVTLTFAAMQLMASTALGAEVTECDRLAADPWDERRITEPAAEEIGGQAAAAVAACKQAVEAQPDEPRLQFQLGRSLLFHGFTAEAVTNLEEAAKAKDYAAAEFHLGLAHARESWSGYDADEAIRYYHKGAMHGHAQAQHNLALVIIERERGDGRAIREAIPWLRAAASQGLAESLYLEGVIWSNGGNTLYPDLELAAELFTKGVALDHDASRLALGVAYVMGRGVKKEPDRGLTLITEAAEHGFTSAQIELGRMYMTGRVVGKNEEQSYQWFCRAKEDGRKHFEMEYGRKLPCNSL